VQSKASPGETTDFGGWHSADIRDADCYNGSASPDNIGMVQEEEPQPYASK
jgi:hypothetical protein